MFTQSQTAHFHVLAVLNFLHLKKIGDGKSESTP